MKKILNRVTVTGADDSTDPKDLLKIQLQYPYVEWGILLSKSSEGSPRFPTKEWLKDLSKYSELNLSGHLCGRWVRDLCAGQNTFSSERPAESLLFKRFQLNFHSYQHLVTDQQRFAEATKSLNADQIILQFDKVNDHLLKFLRSESIDAVPLFDTSGGAGILPNTWPDYLQGIYCGYAGGLSPTNLTEQMEKISKVCGLGPIWIDAESRLRSRDNIKFDLGLVKAFLEKAKPWLQK